MIVGVTGATSGIGQAVTAALRHQDHDVVLFGRTEGLPSSRHFDLSVAGSKPDLRDLDSLIHLAWDWKTPHARSPNLNGGIRLLNQCIGSGVRPILLSTESVHAPQSRYGFQKLKLESFFTDAGGQVVRSGILWGMNATGIIQTLRTICNLPLPCVHFKPRTLLHHSQIEYVAGQLVSAAEATSDQEAVHAWSNEPVSLEEVLHAGQTQRWRPHIPMPLHPLHRIADLLEVLGAPGGIRPDSLRGLQTVSRGQPFTVDDCGFSDFPGANEFLDWFRRSIRPS